MDERVVLGKDAEGKDVPLSYKQRRQHTYVIGVNGTGKSTLLRQIASTDMRQEPKHGLCVIDPHGDLIDDIIALVPKERVDDIILFDPSDEANPFCLNLFAPVTREELPRVASEIVSIFRKIFGRAWTPEIEGVIQNVTLTLLSRPADFEMDEGKQWVAAMDEIPALLAMERVPEEDREKPPWKRKVQTYRSQFYRLLQAQDQIPVWEFWNYNFDTLTPRPRSELTLAVLNQVRRFLANPTVRNIVAQTQSKLDLSEVMGEGKILLANLSKGKLGEANSAFLGSVLVAKLVAAVFARAQTEPASRKPFHIIVDEFQNFAISSFPGLLSEGRKYNVDLVIAHQYREQLRDWVQGATVNAGNVVCFRVGGDDAKELAHEFDATPPEEDVIEPFYSAAPKSANVFFRVGRWDPKDNHVYRAVADDILAIRRKIAELQQSLSAAPAGGREADDPSQHEEGIKREVSKLESRLRDAEAILSELFQHYAEKSPLYVQAEYEEQGYRQRLSTGRKRLQRTYNDMASEIANELTHLPNFHATCRLAGSADPVVEKTFTTIEWPENHEDSAKREELYNSNLEAIQKNTRRKFTRPRKKVAQEFKKRYELMLRSIGMSWTPDKPLPKPQVLLESED